MIGLSISKVVDKNNEKEQPRPAGINFIHNHVPPVGAAPEGVGICL